MKKMNKTLLFLLFTFVLSYGIAAIYKLLELDYTNKLAFILMGAVYMLMPALSVLIVEKIIFCNPVKKELFISFKLNKWFLIAWLSMPLISIASIGISVLFPGVKYNPELSGMIQRFENLLSPEQFAQMKSSVENLPPYTVWLTLIQGLIAGITVNALFALGEELGWRGFLLHQFRSMHFMKASAIIGLIWGIWHAPLILMGHNYIQHPKFGIVMMTVFCILLTPLLLYVTLKAKSVIAAAVMHGTMNATAGFSVMMISGGNDLSVGLSGLAGFITILLFLVSLFIYDRYITKEKLFTSAIQH